MWRQRTHGECIGDPAAASEGMPEITHHHETPGRGQEGFYSESQRIMALRHPAFGLVASRPVGGYFSTVWGHPACGALLQQPLGPHTFFPWTSKPAPSAIPAVPPVGVCENYGSSLHFTQKPCYTLPCQVHPPALGPPFLLLGPHLLWGRRQPL
jgi:hypothetical protein